MIKTFFRRWWVIHRFYSLSRRWDNVKWVKESYLISWVLGLDVNTDIAISETGGLIENRIPWFYISSMKWLYERKDMDGLFNEVRNVIHECKEKKWLKGDEPERDSPYVCIPYVNLDTLGKEKYSISYLVFGTEYAKPIWIAIITGLVIWYFTDRVQHIVPPTVEVKIVTSQAASTP